VADLIGDELGWTAEERAAEAETYRALVAHERETAGLPETALDASIGA
jgi:hypothetical protein